MARLPADPFGILPSQTGKSSGLTGAFGALPSSHPASQADAGGWGAGGGWGADAPVAAGDDGKPTGPPPPSPSTFGGTNLWNVDTMDNGSGKGGGNSLTGDPYFNQNANAATQAYLAQNGISAYGQFGSFVNRLTPTLDAGYQAASALNPNLNRGDYLTSQRPMIDDWYGTQLSGLYAPVRRMR